MKDIPVHLLKERTNLGFQLKRFKKGDVPNEEVETLGAHRDDHYIFFVLEKGCGLLLIDFQEIHLTAATFYYVLPTQVHHRIRNKAAEGWFIAVDTSLIPPQCRQVFESELHLQQPYKLSSNHFKQCHDLLVLLSEKYEEDGTNAFYVPVVHSLLQSLLGIAASYYNGFAGSGSKVSRPVELAGAFKNLLVKQVRTIKSPSAYAAALNVSESYLNEALKKHTGFPVSYWIQQEIMMEAKRLLYYSELNIKEIAYTLGYTDHSYFSRVFRKTSGMSAMTFREQHRK